MPSAESCTSRIIGPQRCPVFSVPNGKLRSCTTWRMHMFDGDCSMWHIGLCMLLLFRACKNFICEVFLKSGKEMQNLVTLDCTSCPLVNLQCILICHLSEFKRLLKLPCQRNCFCSLHAVRNIYLRCCHQILIGRRMAEVQYHVMMVAAQIMLHPPSTCLTVKTCLSAVH